MNPTWAGSSTPDCGAHPKSFSPVLPVPELDGAVAFWTAALGAEPTFVDGDRWAQFDVNGHRLALSGRDRVAGEPALMAKVGDIKAARSRLEAAGAKVGTVQEGGHEARCSVLTPGGWTLVLYSSTPAP
jgi:catechol 2,3-dioxygenase-like lactoylglutathione lyase family enzyme